VTKPLYPCYLFVKTRLFYFLLAIDGITGIVMNDSRPARSHLLDAEIARLQNSERDGFVPEPVAESAPQMFVGKNVVILSGILRGFVGLCTEVRRGRAKIVTSLLGGAAPVWHSEMDLAIANAITRF
jgi:transcription antitermination factor NusG